MKSLKYAVCAAIVALTLAAVEVQGKAKMVPKLYVYGFSASFSDSIVYFTDVQEVDSAWMDTKTEFLLGRDNYSLQLKNYLAQVMAMPNRTCVVMFGKKKNKVEKYYLKLKKQYTSAKSRAKYDVRNVNSTDFRFKGIDMSFIIEADEDTKKAEKPAAPDRKKPGRGEMPPNGQPMPPNGPQM